MPIVFGLILLCLFILGAALFFLALVFLAINLGLQLFGATIGGGAAWLPSLTTSVQLASGSAFALGVVLVGIGLIAFLSPAVRAFVKGLALLFRLALSPVFTDLMRQLPNVLRQTAAVLDGGGRFLVSPTDPAHAPDSPDAQHHPLTMAGNDLNNASSGFPEVPVITYELKPLWLKIENNHYVEGYVPQPLLAPDKAQVVTSLSQSAATVTPVTSALSNLGGLLHDAGYNAINVGSDMRQAATTLDHAADLIEQVFQ